MQEARVRQAGDLLEVTAGTRGLALKDGGYLWRGELRLWDNETLMGWYVADEAAVRAKGTMFFHLHEHGQRLIGRWVGLSYDGPVVTGWAAMGRTESETEVVMTQLRSEETAG